MSRWHSWLKGEREGQSAGEVAKINAEHHYSLAKQQRNEVRDVADSLRSLRERNHFADAIEQLIRGT